MKKNLFRSGWVGLMLLSFLSPSLAITRYVDQSASGANNGTSWANAYTSLEAAIAEAHSNFGIDSILVAQGTYFPEVIAGSTADPRDRAFLFTRDGLAVLGGYPSGGGVRDFVNNVTVLNGDLGITNDITDNAIHIVVAVGTIFQAIDSTLVIDGFTFINGNANITANNTINGMDAAKSNGGAIYTYYSGTKISNCTFNNNNADYGGAIFAQESTAIITDCSFNNNSATLNGGALDNVSSGLTVRNSVFTDNAANNGGAIAFHTATTPQVNNTIFAGNTSEAWGGGVFNNESSPEYINCLFYGNAAPTGAALATYNNATPVFINTTIADNNGGFGGAMYNATNVEVMLINCIVYGNNTGILGDGSSAYSHFNSLIQENFSTSFGNLNGYITDPLFENPSYYFLAPFSSDADYRLQNGSPCINAGDNNAVPPMVTHDLAGNDRIMFNTVDMGAYEKEDVVLCNLSLTANKTDISCFGEATGMITINVTGGTAPFQYALNGGAFTNNNTFNNLAAGTYVIVVADNASCTEEITVTLTQPASAVVATATGTNLACFGDNNGSISVNVSGGLAPYQYAINGGAFTNNNTFNNLAAGTYLIVVKDNASCTDEIEVTLTQPASAVVATATGTNLACFGDNNGSISVNASGGTAPYQYAINGGAFTNNNTFNNLAAGTYLIVVKDNASCTDEIEVTLTQPASAVVATATKTDLACFGDNTGSISVNASGGTAPYQYAINGGAFTNNNTFNNLAAGTYLIVVKDNASCADEIEVTLTQPASPLQATATKTDLACFGDNNGSISVNVSGGTAPYQYAINGGDFTEENTFNDLVAGTYLILVTDNASCADEIEVTLTQPAAALQSTAVITHPACFGESNGAISVSVSGGTPPYNYSWNNEATEPEINNLGIGSYTLITTDENGCQIFDTFQIENNNDSLFIDLGPDRTLCAEQAAVLSVDLEMEDVSYAWTSDNGFTSNAEQVTVSDAGTYSLTVTTPEGCTASDNIVIAVSTATVTSDFIVASQGFMDSVITMVNITDPKPDSVHWLLPPSCTIISMQNSYAEISFADTGIYEVGMRAFMGECYEDKISQLIIVETSVDIMPDVPRYPFIKEYRAYPNPSNGNFTVEIELQKESDVNLTLINATTGLFIDTRQESIPKKGLVQYNLTLDSGTYILLLETPYGFRSIKIEILL